MRYYVTIGGRTFEVDLSGGAATVDGQPVAAELRTVPGTPIRHLLADGRSFGLVAGRGEARGVWDLHVDGQRYAVEVVDERARAIRAMTGAGQAPQGSKPVRAPMPGLVVRVEVEAGQSVRAGQGVVIIEAMKMENELKAEAEGVVARVLVQQGQAVEKGAVLVEFER
ncbi:MAG TPA: biotin/lipoyl-containing protein [Longimicrobiales bacterium]